MSWKPIQTIPKETQVLVWNAMDKYYIVASSENGELLDYRFRDVEDDQFTHWMPLPPPPEDI